MTAPLKKISTMNHPHLLASNTKTPNTSLVGMDKIHGMAVERQRKEIRREGVRRKREQINEKLDDTTKELIQKRGKLTETRKRAIELTRKC